MSYSVQYREILGQDIWKTHYTNDDLMKVVEIAVYLAYTMRITKEVYMVQVVSGQTVVLSSVDIMRELDRQGIKNTGTKGANDG